MIQKKNLATGTTGIENILYERNQKSIFISAKYYIVWNKHIKAIEKTCLKFICIRYIPITQILNLRIHNKYTDIRSKCIDFFKFFLFVIHRFLINE